MPLFPFPPPRARGTAVGPMPRGVEWAGRWVKRVRASSSPERHTFSAPGEQPRGPVLHGRRDGGGRQWRGGGGGGDGGRRRRPGRCAVGGWRRGAPAPRAAAGAGVQGCAGVRARRCRAATPQDTPRPTRPPPPRPPSLSWRRGEACVACGASLLPAAADSAASSAQAQAKAGRRCATSAALATRTAPRRCQARCRPRGTTPGSAPTASTPSRCAFAARAFFVPPLVLSSAALRLSSLRSAARLLVATSVVG